jgi:hypothetical protein
VKRRRVVALSLGLALVALGCQRGANDAVEAEFGVFFGGQVQELKELPKELDPGRQQHGFRLTFRSPPARDVAVSWELSLPATGTGDKSGPRAALVGRATAKAGQRVLDIPLAFRPSDPLGSWHAKLAVENQVVVDRDFQVIAATPQKSAPRALTPRSPGP